MIIGNTASERQENVVVNEGTNDQDFTVGTSNVSTAMNKNAMTVKTLERCFNERVDREMNNIVDTVEDRIQNAILAAIDNIVAPKIELAIGSINASSGRDVTSVCANSERRELTGINISFENASENDNTICVTNINDEARRNSQDGVSKLSVPKTQFHRQSQTHHVLTRGSEQTHNPHHMMTELSSETHHRKKTASQTKKLKPISLPMQNQIMRNVKLGKWQKIIRTENGRLRFLSMSLTRQNEGESRTVETTGI